MTWVAAAATAVVIYLSRNNDFLCRISLDARSKDEKGDSSCAICCGNMEAVVCFLYLL